MSAPYPAIAVSNWFIFRALNELADMTPMKVQKLVYIAHGWYMGITGMPLILERAEAWQYGPVIPVIYHFLKKYGNNQVRQLITDDRTFQTPFVPKSDVLTVAVLEKIWELYGKYDGIALSQMTHIEATPWSRRWKELQKRETTDYIIPNSYIASYYSELVKPKEHAHA